MVSLSQADYLLFANPSLVASEEAAFVERAAEDEFAVFRVNFAVVELAGFGIEDFAADELVFFLVVTHTADDDESFERFVVVFPFALVTFESGFSDEHFGDFAVIEAVGTFVDGNDGEIVSRFVIDCFPFSEDEIDLRRGRNSEHK